MGERMKQIGRGAKEYRVHAQGPRGSKIYPSITPPVGSLEIGARVHIFQITCPGSVMLRVGDLVIRPIQDKP
jgi:hypothetical protein